MLLRSLEIKNYRSLEHVLIDKLERINVFIGRNNSGKSSVFGALTLLNQLIRGEQPDWSIVLTARDVNRKLDWRILFEVEPSDREEFLALAAIGHPPERLNKIRNSGFLRQLELSYRRSPNCDCHLTQIRMIAEDGAWAEVARLNGDERENNPTYLTTNLSQLIATNRGPYNQALIDIGSSPSRSQPRLNANYLQGFGQVWDTGTKWLLDQLAVYYRKSFFFNPFRHSAAQLSVQQSDTVQQTGANLAQVLHTINSNDRPLLERIQAFVQAAVPDIGALQTPLEGTSTRVSFRSPEGYHVRLEDMGGGVEQLLMVAAVLLTTAEDCPLFLEEPESHLHAGAQRFLIEQLHRTKRQVFLTTHSSVFINSPGPHSLYQVVYHKNRTTVTHVKAPEELSAVLGDIGTRNSDVLLSEAVLFVEGPSDQAVMLIWSDTLQLSLAERNVGVLPMGGGDDPGRNTRARSDVLVGISQRAPVAHLFLLDGDERPEREIRGLSESLAGRLHIWARREIENYLLVPRAILETLKEKHRDNATIVEKVNQCKESELDELMRRKAEELRTVVLVKRIRSEIPKLRDSLIDRSTIMRLAADADKADLPVIIEKQIDGRIQEHLKEVDLAEIVSRERAKLATEWSKESARLLIAPGEEILRAVFENFDSEYDKSRDAARIAQKMRMDEIDAEVNTVIRRAAELATT